MYIFSGTPSRDRRIKRDSGLARPFLFLQKNICFAVQIPRKLDICMKTYIILSSKNDSSILDRQVRDCPDVSEKTGSKHNGKYEQDITALREKFGNSFITGLCIKITLKEALGMMPRNRKRVDAYYGLTRYLQEEYGITLTIYSQKTKPNDHEEDNL